MIKDHIPKEAELTKEQLALVVKSCVESGDYAMSYEVVASIAARKAYWYAKNEDGRWQHKRN